MATALLAALGASLAALAFPFGALRVPGRALGFFVGSVLRVRRGEVVARLSAAGVDAPAAVADAMYASLGTGLLELLWTGLPGPRPLDGKVELTVRAEEALALAARGGAVVATAHVGNWDLVACAVAGRAPLHVVSKRLSVRALDRAWQWLRARRGVRLIAPRGALGGGRAAIADGGLVAMIIDQAPERRSGVLLRPFLGTDALHDTGPATLAARAGAPLLLALGRRRADGTHEVDVPLLLAPPARAGRAWIEEATLALSAGLEAHIRRDPSQWLWLHRRWKLRRVAPPRAAW